MKMFKVGDKVRRVNYHEFDPHLFDDHNNIFTVDKIHYESKDKAFSIGLAEDKSAFQGFDPKWFELASESPTNDIGRDAYINEIIETANKGEKAAYELLENYGEMVLIGNSSNGELFREVANKYLDRSYRIFKRKPHDYISSDDQWKISQMIGIPEDPINKWVSDAQDPHPRIKTLIAELARELKNE